jgi:hypothetical protein
VEAEFIVARTFLQSEIATTASNIKWTPLSVLQQYGGPLSAMLTGLLALKHD